MANNFGDIIATLSANSQFVSYKDPSTASLYIFLMSKPLNFGMIVFSLVNFNLRSQTIILKSLEWLTCLLTKTFFNKNELVQVSKKHKQLRKLFINYTDPC